MFRFLFFGCITLWAVLPAYSEVQSDKICATLTAAAAAWNKGDLTAFVSVYEDSTDTTFIGKEVTHGGTKKILERYRRDYPTHETMGTLTFSECKVRLLSKGFALSSGKWALERTKSAGGDASGRFTLVWRRTRLGWKIIHDHTS